MIYKKFLIRKGINPWGDESFFVYDSNGQQMFDDHETIADAKEAIDLYLNE